MSTLDYLTQSGFFPLGQNMTPDYYNNELKRALQQYQGMQHQQFSPVSSSNLNTNLTKIETESKPNKLLLLLR
jgi:hypothetical protein